MISTETQTVLDDIVGRISARFDPEKIVLFGSYARGGQGKDSDMDLLVVMNGIGSKRKKAVEIDISLVGVPIATDVIVVSTEDVEKARRLPGTMLGEALREGRILYERAA